MTRLAKQDKKLKIVVIGDLVLDVITRLPGSLKKIYRGSDTITQIESHPGGAGANTAIWLARLGADVRFVSRVGDDILGDALIANLKKERVTSYVARDSRRPTGVLVSLVEPDGERSMLTGPAAHFFLDAKNIPKKIFSGADAVYLSGYLFYRETPHQAAWRAIELARENGARIAIDPASVGLMKAVPTKFLLADLCHTDILLANLGEACFLAQALSRKETNQTQAKKILHILLEKIPTVGLKLGAKGSLSAVSETKKNLNARLRKECFAPAEKIVSIVDSTGCGDAWNAAFLFYLLDGAKLDRAAKEANALAAWVLQRAGATPSRNF
jgi:sugar/nucleoside kinase (ribokinase family)